MQSQNQSSLDTVLPCGCCCCLTTLSSSSFASQVTAIANASHGGNQHKKEQDGNHNSTLGFAIALGKGPTAHTFGMYHASFGRRRSAILIFVRSAVGRKNRGGATSAGTEGTSQCRG
jgi:hypothetical protein